MVDNKLLKQKRNPLNLLYEINEYINKTRDIKIILKGILKIIKEFYLYDILLLYFWDSERNKILLETSTEKDLKAEFNPGEGLAGTIFQIKQIVSSKNILKNPNYLNVLESGEKEYIEYLGVPVLLQATCVGILEIWNKKGNSVIQKQQKIIQIICSRISGLLEVGEILEKFKIPKTSSASITYHGFSLSKGIAIGKSYIIPELLQNEYFKIKDKYMIDIENEKQRLTSGFDKTILEMKILIKSLEDNKKVSDSEINIFKAHLMILQDDTFKEDIISRIEKKKLKAEICLSECIEDLTNKFKNMDDPYFKDRAYDFIDIGQRIIIIMQSQGSARNLSLTLPDNSIVIAEYISPSLLVSLDKSKIKGIIVEKGGRSSHTAILAQSLNIPAVCEVKNINHIIPTNTAVLIDGNHGVVIVNPVETTIINYQTEIKKEEYIKKIFEQKYSESNLNQQNIEIAANISFIQDIEWAKKYDIQTIGLVRSEFFFMRFSSWPDIKEQVSIYKELASSFKSKVNIRLVDIGADKKLPFIDHKTE